ncbi:MAG: hypothetical protein IT200_12360 [Thermoleophilia bacterium]|nr:hypothetical protein [Thermoleophilia bacterium]
MSTVNRCIAIAAHGRRCQQTTYRGGPYCWHHTQSRKVWPPSRVQARQRKAAAPAAAPPAELPALRVEPALSPLERISQALTDEQLEELAEFLSRRSFGTFRIRKADGEVVDARPDVALPYPLSRRSASA